jgi:hypothetical protein
LTLTCDLLAEVAGLIKLGVPIGNTKNAKTRQINKDRIVRLFFQKIKLTSLDFYFRRFTRLNLFVLEKKVDTSAHPEGLQTFENHLKFD